MFKKCKEKLNQRQSVPVGDDSRSVQDELHLAWEQGTGAAAAATRTLFDLILIN